MRHDYSGCSVSGAGDVNGDGVDDLIIGAWHADPNGSSAGQSYVVFGGTGCRQRRRRWSSLRSTARNGFALNGINAGDWSG